MLKLLALKKTRSAKAAELTTLRNQRTELRSNEEALKVEVEAATDISPELQTRIDTLTHSQTEVDDRIIALTEEIEKCDEEIRSLENQPGTPASERQSSEPQQRSAAARPAATVEAGEFRSQSGCFRSRAARDMFYARNDVREFLAAVRSCAPEGSRGVQGAGLTIPTVMLELIRDNIGERSKLVRYVSRRDVNGAARQTITGNRPEGVWTESCGSLNELNLQFTQVEVDGYKVGGYIAICNSTLADSDINLGEFIMDSLLDAIGIALDKAILYGKGGDQKMPVGIVTRLAQQSKPGYWGKNQGTWTDLHTSNILKLNLGAKSGVEFYMPLIQALGKADPKYSRNGTVWVMNRRTHMDLMSRGLAFTDAGTLVAGVNTRMPAENGEIVELDFIPDYEFVGGFMSDYLLAEREGGTIAQSSEVRFLQDQTVYKGTARYDGVPVYGEGFILVNYNNVKPSETVEFAPDFANEKMNVLICTAAAGSGAGQTKVTVAGELDTSNNTLAYQVQNNGGGISVGDLAEAFEPLESGTTDIKAAAGTPICVVELTKDKRVVSLGTVLSVPHA